MQKIIFFYKFSLSKQFRVLGNSTLQRFCLTHRIVFLFLFLSLSPSFFLFAKKWKEKKIQFLPRRFRFRFGVFCFAREIGKRKKEGEGRRGVGYYQKSAGSLLRWALMS